MSSEALLFTLSAIGIAETVYLIKQRKIQKAPVCPVGSQEACQIVLESKYNKIFGVHNDIFGLIFYLAASFLTALLVTEVGPKNLLESFIRLMIGGGVVFSLFLTYLQWKVLRAWCFWCLMSAITILLMLIIIIL